MALQLALIGAGRIGKVHAHAIATAIPGAKLAAVADPYVEAAHTLAQQYGVAVVSSDPLDVLKRADIDAVIRASSTDTHAPLMIAAAAAGKHIFCEKPIAARLSDIDAALNAVEQAGVKLQIGFNRRFDASFRRIRQAIDSGEIGTPHLLHIISRDPAPPPVAYVKVSGGMFFDMTIHDFDMARFLFGEVETIYAVGRVLVNPAIGEAGDIDTALITLQFVSGALGTIDNSRQAVYGYDQRVPAYVSELQDFVDCLAQDRPASVSGYDGRVPVVMAMAARRSYLEQRPVHLSEITHDENL